ncbi:MAG: DoxX family membrane protein [Propionibacteriaceae bacterium]|jgi:uncharacterized membrane protein YphA (DoxX/SURF4 family)|nr:DoxX family membrane protein [Propionibacteriaceae bacterium]
MNDELSNPNANPSRDHADDAEAARQVGLPSVELSADADASDTLRTQDAAPVVDLSDNEGAESQAFSLKDSSLFRSSDSSDGSGPQTPSSGGDAMMAPARVLGTDKPVDAAATETAGLAEGSGGKATAPTIISAASSGSASGAPDLPEGTIDLTDTPLAPTPSPLAAPDSLYRSLRPEPIPGTVEVDQPVNPPNETIIMPVESVLDDHRAARARALGEVDPGADVVAAPAQFLPPSIYKRWPSFTLFIFRLVVAAVLGIRATQEWMNFEAIKGLWAGSILPQAEIVAIVQFVVEYLVAVLLLLGLGSRVAGVLLFVLNASVLCFVVWGAVNPFTNGVVGFAGEYNVLMAAIGLLFAGIGGGGAAVDAVIHRARLERKNAKIGQD